MTTVKGTDTITIMTQYFGSCKSKHNSREFFAKFGLNRRDNPDECARIMAKVQNARKKYAVKLFGKMDAWPRLVDSRQILSFDEMQAALEASGFNIQGNPIVNIDNTANVTTEPEKKPEEETANS